MNDFIYKKVMIFLFTYLTGHDIFPTLYRDMQNPAQYSRVINYTYILTAIIYLLIAVFGYVMFGHTVMQEVSLSRFMQL